MSSISRSAFQALDHVAKMSHIRSGFKIIDDAPIADPFEGAKNIMDGAERLRWIESKRQWDAEIAALKAADLAKDQAEFVR